MPKQDPHPPTHRGQIWRPATCAACDKCWLDQFGRCLYGGPFAGYADATTGKPV